MSDHGLVALDDEVAPLTMLVGDGIDSVCIDEESSVRLDFDDGAVLLVHSDLVSGDDFFQIFRLELLLGALGHAHEKGILHAPIEVAVDFPLGLGRVHAAEAAHEPHKNVPHGAFATTLRAYRADDDSACFFGDGLWKWARMGTEELADRE